MKKPGKSPWAILPLALAILLCLLPGCSGQEEEPLSLDNLEGKKIGAMIGYSSDYILTKYDYGVELYRYSLYSDMQLALKFKKIDAAAMEMDEAKVFVRNEPGFKIAMNFKEGIDYGYYFNAEKNELREQFNTFIKEFRKTDTYSDLVKRAGDIETKPFVAKHVENTPTTDKVVKVCVLGGWEPVSYLNTANDQWEDVDIELITHFANSLGARIEFKELSWEQMLIELGQGIVDLSTCPDSFLLKTDLEMSGKIRMSEAVWLKDIVFIVNKEGK